MMTLKIPHLLNNSEILNLEFHYVLFLIIFVSLVSKQTCFNRFNFKFLIFSNPSKIAWSNFLARNCLNKHMPNKTDPLSGILSKPLKYPVSSVRSKSLLLLNYHQFFLILGHRVIKILKNRKLYHDNIISVG